MIAKSQLAVEPGSDFYSAQFLEDPPTSCFCYLLLFSWSRRNNELCEGLEDAEDNESAESLEELFSVGGTVWPCAAALCRWLSENREQTVRGARVLELGAGTGACGLYASACGAAHVTLTDHTPRLLKLMEKNCERNTLAGNLPGLGTATTISFEGFSWNASPRPKGQFDLVIGSDVRLHGAFQPSHVARAALCM